VSSVYWNIWTAGLGAKMRGKEGECMRVERSAGGCCCMYANGMWSISINPFSLCELPGWLPVKSGLAHK